MVYCTDIISRDHGRRHVPQVEKKQRVDIPNFLRFYESYDPGKKLGINLNNYSFYRVSCYVRAVGLNALFSYLKCDVLIFEFVSSFFLSFHRIPRVFSGS